MTIITVECRTPWEGRLKTHTEKKQLMAQGGGKRRVLNAGEWTCIKHLLCVGHKREQVKYCFYPQVAHSLTVCDGVKIRAVYKPTGAPNLVLTSRGRRIQERHPGRSDV